MPMPQRRQPGVDAEHTERHPNSLRGIHPTAGVPRRPVLVELVLVELCLHVGRDLEVREHVLHVVGVLEGIDQPEHLACGVGVDLDAEVGDELGLGRVVVDPRLLERGTSLHQSRRVGDDLESTALIVDLFGTGIEHGEQDVVLTHAVGLGDRDHALAAEVVGDAARIRHRAAVARHRGAHICRGAVAVVGEALDQEGDAVRAVALVHDRVVIDGLARKTGTALDRAIDVVVGHRGLLGLLHGIDQRSGCRRGRRRVVQRN